MLVIRLSRTGRKKQPYYRVVVAEKSAPIKGRLVEVLGHFNPRTKDLKIDVDRAKARVAAGAQPSETAEALLEKAGVLKRSAITEKNRRPGRKKRKEIKAEAAGDGAAPAAAAPADSDAAAQSDDTPADDSAKDEAKADEKTEAKSEKKTEAKTEEKSAGKSEDKAQAKTDEKTDDKLAEPATNDKEAKGDSK